MSLEHHYVSIYQALQEHYNQWLEYWCKTIMPPVVFRWSKEGKNVAFVTRYCERHGIKIVQNGTDHLLYHENNLVARFQVTFKT